jgi:N-methylhydantoinase B
MEFQPGDECIIRVPGGGGFGPPQERETERVRKDVILDYVTREAAEEIYELPVDS